MVPADLNDAPAGIKPEDQYDNLCELPGPTGVIDAKAPLGALLRLAHPRSLARSISQRARRAILLRMESTAAALRRVQQLAERGRQVKTLLRSLTPRCGSAILSTSGGSKGRSESPS